MKISELKDKKITRRATRSFDEFGNRIYNKFEYEIPYNPTHENNETERLFAKIIDMLPFFLIFIFVFHKIVIVSVFLSIPSVIIFGTITECFFGTTLGKKIFRIKIIDEHGNYPNILRSFARNFLCLANFCSILIDYEPRASSDSETQTNLSMHMNNKLCKTYIVKESKIAEIRSLLDVEQPKNKERLIE
ncbi:hypothetical protein QFZ37_002288 [Chryseobacterium ginsenosidimutans]|uniref:RDD family protein n=1 Tax=Chryseobacterium ginsenosidimutans TaxID=687846 RepID=UPI0027870AD6|nr:RDD family protein [Chryseobacterium ginsenosidimutans]MDQ0593919.1 hypothetical protein [Chryseobacterium ginsenosidimutans]